MLPCYSLPRHQVGAQCPLPTPVRASSSSWLSSSMAPPTVTTGCMWLLLLLFLSYKPSSGAGQTPQPFLPVACQKMVVKYKQCLQVRSSILGRRIINADTLRCSTNIKKTFFLWGGGRGAGQAAASKGPKLKHQGAPLSPQRTQARTGGSLHAGYMLWSNWKGYQLAVE